jgi:hypothetical protein
MSETAPEDLPETKPNDEVGVPGASGDIPPPVEGIPPVVAPPVTGGPIDTGDGGAM